MLSKTIKELITCAKKGRKIKSGNCKDCLRFQWCEDLTETTRAKLLTITQAQALKIYKSKKVRA